MLDKKTIKNLDSRTIEVPWGTSQSIKVRDPVDKIVTDLKAHGTFKLLIYDSKTFIDRLHRDNISLYNEDEIADYLFEEVKSCIRTEITLFFKNSKYEIIETISETDVLSNQIYVKINPKFREYGLTLDSFKISSITSANNPQREKLEEAVISRKIKAEDTNSKIEQLDKLNKLDKSEGHRVIVFDGGISDSPMQIGTDGSTQKVNQIMDQDKENKFSSEAIGAIHNIATSTDLTQTQKDALTKLINEAKKATQDEDDTAKGLCKDKFIMFISGAGDIVKETLKIVLPPLILMFFGLSK